MWRAARGESARLRPWGETTVGTYIPDIECVGRIRLQIIQHKRMVLIAYQISGGGIRTETEGAIHILARADIGSGEPRHLGLIRCDIPCRHTQRHETVFGYIQYEIVDTQGVEFDTITAADGNKTSITCIGGEKDFLVTSYTCTLFIVNCSLLIVNRPLFGLG